ncbi:MAG: cobyric acid synthase [bacterium]|nr:cobyric acid synthase [bacterium]MDY4099254.1 cobyric acid synthase [Lachnospiraceae bacterium]
MAKNIMIQGTMSGAGKSLLVAGLCRIFKQDGYKVAPFKSQNMALNSFITKEGLEMGRAQVVQAQAAGIEPSVRMNPILLKPMSDVGSQVIVNGEVRGNMSARDYFAYKKSLLPDIKKAYDSLAAENDIIVIEGAGSPAEINLKENDIVNMGMAELVDAPVLLVGDIDRGGVFAQLVGTVALLEPEERARVRGLVINKFRGDKTILDPGIEQLKQFCDIPVVGVTPYLKIDIEDEDSLSERLDSHKKEGIFDVAVIRLPHISNFTDFLVLEHDPRIGLRYVERSSQLGTPDLILLPGTKNTMDDLRWLRTSGMEAVIQKAHADGSILFGICGGYQMLGKRLSDPAHVEAGGELAGLGFLPQQTVFTKEKTRTQVRGRIGQIQGALAGMTGCEIEGYEIHMGETTACAGADTAEKVCAGAEANGSKTDRSVPLQKLTVLTDELTGETKTDGAFTDNVYGTYVHGIFDAEGMVPALVRSLAARRGIDLDQIEGLSLAEYREKQFDLLAAALREHLDMEYIYRVVGEN